MENRSVSTLFLVFFGGKPALSEYEVEETLAVITSHVMPCRSGSNEPNYRRSAFLN